jgi:hypothetical protein
MQSEPGSSADELDTLAKAIGLIVIQWGQAEQSLDLLIALLWQSFDGKRFAKRIPVMLEPKIKFVRECMTREPSLAGHQAAATALLDSFEELSSLRHDLIHGAVASVSTIDDAFVFAKLDVRDGFHHHREVRIEAHAYPRLIDQIVALGKASHELVAAVFADVKNGAPSIK